MSALLFLSLPLSLLIVAALATLAFLDVAWKTPSLTGTTGLRRAAEPFVMRPAIEMVRVAECLTGEMPPGETELICPEAPFVPQVTEPEAQAIAADITRNGAREVRRALERSRAHDGICPMRLQNGMCACSVARPLECVGRCFAGADSPEWAKGLGQSVSTAFRQHLESHHANAATRRLDQALVEVLDGSHLMTAVARN